MRHELSLYGDTNYFSPYVMAVFITLTEKQLPFTFNTLDLDAGKQLEANYAALSLTSRVPTLIHNEFALSESSAIIEYLEESFPAPDFANVLPQDKFQRARARQVQAWLRSDYLIIRTERSADMVLGKTPWKPLSEAAQAACNKLCAAVNALLPNDHENLFGNWCIADTELAFMLNRLVATEVKVPAKIADYVAAQWARPSMQQWLALSKQKLG